MPFAAFQVLKGESDHEIVHGFMQAVDAKGKTFKRLKTLGRLEMGSRTFLRVLTSCPVSRLKVIGLAWGVESMRCVILPDLKTGIYHLFDQGLRKGEVMGVAMAMTPKPGYGRVYRGPGESMWERQFQDQPDTKS